MSKYESIPDGQQASIVYPNIQAMITGIAMVKQNNLGEITVHDSGMRVYDLGIVKDGGEPLDIIALHNKELENYLATKLMPLCI